MKALPRKILFNSVMIVILLHSIVPHGIAHIINNNSDQIISCSYDASLMDLFKTVFQENENGNLDNQNFNPYNLSKKIFPDLNLYSLAVNIGDLVDNKTIYFVKMQEDFYRKINNFIVTIYGLRAPPFNN